MCAEAGIGNKLIIRDRGGARTGSLAPITRDRLMLRDRYGCRISTVERRWALGVAPRIFK